MNKTSISWTDFTSSPIKPVERGWMCAKVSTGCEHCYSEALNMRYGNKKSFNAVNLSNTEFRIDENEIKRIKKVPSGSNVFLQDMTDIFNEKIPFELIEQVMEVIKSKSDVTFQILTKRPDRLASFLHYHGYVVRGGDHHYDYFLPRNIWIGVSVETKRFTDRINELYYLKYNWEVLPNVTFISFEPLLDDIGNLDMSGISWIVIGGESGSHHRPMKIEWARNLVRQAKNQGVAVWMKQLGGFRPGGELEDFPDDLRIREFPKEIQK